MERTSYHYRKDRQRREDLIQEIGLGEVVYTTTQYSEKRGRTYLYEVTTNAILIVKSVDIPDFVVTKIVARPSRLLQYWENPPQEILDKAILHSRLKYTF